MALITVYKANTVGRTEIQALGQTTHCLLSEGLIDIDNPRIQSK